MTNAATTTSTAAAPLASIANDTPRPGSHGASMPLLPGRKRATTKVAMVLAIVRTNVATRLRRASATKMAPSRGTRRTAKAVITAPP